ncbi:MAG: hypothetical protein JWP97_6103 [Labilithrix sp.]|nr:hypothetical protein [Labilithrix sp.]
MFAHLGLLSVAGLVAYHFSQSRDAHVLDTRTAAPSAAYPAELPTFDEGTLLAEHEVAVEGIVPVAHGGATVARVDTGARGQGGEATSVKATNLAARAEDLSLSPDLLSRLDREQEQRLRNAEQRQTRDDRRSTTHPMELTFLASGAGEHQERRPSAARDPSRGSLVVPRPASVTGGRAGTRETDDAEAAGAIAGGPRPGQLLASPGQGVRNGAPGADHVAAARIALGRPAVAEGPPSITAAYQGRPKDTVDSDQEVAALVQSSVHASYAGGFAGAGVGGSPGPAPDPGAGGSDARGSASHVLGNGDGEVFDFFTDDPQLVPYFRKIHARIDPLWRNAFPKSALLELKQGTVILDFTIARDGTVSVSWPPRRPSGIDEFDRNCADAIRRAGPFEPIPAALLALGRQTLHIRAPFVAANPIIK